ncbi:MAG TPA: YsnF/AvaK domain-containing protein [Candidatus Limnocylindria bacterium]|nr:YsnF/AvaK domain-containing protein [Candidatus Limnocylindria bacterium]
MDTRNTEGRASHVDWSEQGYELYDASGDKVGDIVEVNPSYLIVELEGGLLQFLGLSESRTIYVPRDAIAREDGEHLFLNIDKDRLEEHQTWTDQPEQSFYGEGGTADQSHAGGTQAAGGTGYTDESAYRDSDRQGRTRLVRYEEELEAEKVSRQAGEVSIGKHVVEENRTIEVPVRREEVHIERHPVGASADASQSVDADLRSGDAFTEERISVPLMEEDVEVRKVARPVEEVEITKTQTEETRHVDDSVRREEFDIDDSTARRYSDDR